MLRHSRSTSIGRDRLFVALGLIGLVAAAVSSPAHAEVLTASGAPSAGTPAGFLVVLPLRDRSGLDTLIQKQQDPSSSLYHQWLKPSAFNERFGPTSDAVSRAQAALSAAGLNVAVDGRTLHVSGSVASVEKAFGTSLAVGTTRSGVRRLFARRSLVLPTALAGTGAMVLGLDATVHEAHTFMRKAVLSSTGQTNPDNRASKTGAYWYDDLRQAYQYPSYQTTITVNGQTRRLDGTGTTVGILMSADVLDSDIALMFNHENFIKNSGQARNPSLYKRVPVNGGSTVASGAFGEASLDVQQSLGGAPGSHVVLYSIPDLTNTNIVAGYLRIVNDNEADVVSSSFGGCELAYTAAYNDGVDYTGELELEHEIFLQGNAQGITFLASSGDEAGLQCPTANYVTHGTAGQFVASVSSPANDPAVTAVGGTNLVTSATSGSTDSTYVSENAYGDPEVAYDYYSLGALVSGGYWGAGGGVSSLEPKPDYQTTSGINTGSNSYRAVPDIGMMVGGCPAGEAVLPCNGGNSPLDGSGNTDRSSVVLVENGALSAAIGTSVASPEFSSVVALLVERYGRMGNLNPYIYALGTAQTNAGSNNLSRSTTSFHRSIPGYNGVVTNNQPVNLSGRYFNYTVGNGTPVVTHFIGLPTATPAGTPQSASNP